MNFLTVFSIFQSNMVLQRQKPIIIWGNAPSKSSVTVQLDDSDKKTVCQNHSQTDNEGKWTCTLPSMEAGEGFTITITCDADCCDTIILENISIGDVWLACGQSNMEYFLCYDKDWETVKQYPKNPKIHMYNVPQLAFKGHQKNTDGYGAWITEGDYGFEMFSAPGYSFARNIQPHIDVPIGIIGCNWGGTTASTWLDESYLKNAPLSVYLDEYEQALNAYSAKELERLSLAGWEFGDSEKQNQAFMPIKCGREWETQLTYVKDHANDPFIPLGPWSINRPGGLYHQMLEPLIPFAIKGALWYQGETDSYHAEIYDKLLSTMITCWREKWNDEFPFLFVQLAPFGKWLHCVSDRYQEVREKQEIVSKTLAGTGMVSIMDIGSYYDIHPKDKMEVGRRLALLARGKVYGETILCESPELMNAKRSDIAKITLTFDHCQKLSITELDTAPLNWPKNCEQSRFPGCITKPYQMSVEEIALLEIEKSLPTLPTPVYTQIISHDEIKSFVLMQDGKEVAIDSIHLEDNTVIVTANGLSSDPCNISLAWADYAVVNLVNEAGLPVKPFMTTI